MERIAQVATNLRQAARHRGVVKRVSPPEPSRAPATPSLRHRQADIPQIAADILRELAEQNPLESKRLSPAALELLTGYDWPGNVKQLQGVIEQGFFKAQSSVILPTDLVLPGGSGWGKAWKRDRNVFMEAWKACGGNISRLAANLGVSRVTLYRYLEKYGLERNRK